MKHDAPRMNEAAPHWRAAKAGVLSLPRCASCARYSWPPRAACGECGGVLEWAACRGTGTIVTYSVVRRAVDPGLKDDVPYVVAIVELDEGPRLFANIVDADPEALRAGLAVTCRFEPTLDPDAWVPVFSPC